MQINNKFFKIKIKKQNYLGKPAIAIYISHVTKKIIEKLRSLNLREKH